MVPLHPTFEGRQLTIVIQKEGSKSRSSHIGQTLYSHLRGPYKQNISNPYTFRTLKNKRTDLDPSPKHLLHHQNKISIKEEEENDGLNISSPTTHGERDPFGKQSPKPTLMMNCIIWNVRGQIMLNLNATVG